MSEYTEMLGRRVQLRQERGRKVAAAEALRSQLRQKLNPLEDISDADHEAIGHLAIELGKEILAIRETDRQLNKIREIVGE